MINFNLFHSIRMEYYFINFGYTQVLFMGSVPRINRLLTTVLFLHDRKQTKNILNNSRNTKE
jgi:hypothetical protein